MNKNLHTQPRTVVELPSQNLSAYCAEVLKYVVVVALSIRRAPIYLRKRPNALPHKYEYNIL